MVTKLLCRICDAELERLNHCMSDFNRTRDDAEQRGDVLYFCHTCKLFSHSEYVFVEESLLKE